MLSTSLATAWTRSPTSLKHRRWNHPSWSSSGSRRKQQIVPKIKRESQSWTWSRVESWHWMLLAGGGNELHHQSLHWAKTLEMLQCFTRPPSTTHHRILSTYPMLPVDVFVSIPLSGQERVSLWNNLRIEEGRQGWKLGRESSDLQISAQVAVLLVDMLQSMEDLLEKIFMVQDFAS